MPIPSGALILRNYPDDDALVHPERYPKAMSFCPDIIPLYGVKADQNALVHPTSWRGFTGMPIVGGDVNNVFVRGHGCGGPYLATLRVFPSELICWPHHWVTVPPVSSGPVVIRGGDTVGPYASEGHFQFRPPHAAGNAYSMVVNVFKHDPVNVQKNLQDYEPLPQIDHQRFDVNALTSFLAQDTSTSYYNVIVADPTLKHISANTRLRMFSKSPVPVSFQVDWHKGTQMPDGLEVSLMDEHGKITIPRTQLKSFGERKFVLDATYDGHLTLHIFAPARNAFFEAYSGLSLQVSNTALPLAATGNLLGALNIIFDPHSTRNLRHASPSATQLREYKDCRNDDDCYCPGKPKDCAVIPVTKPAATGWWFRAALNSTNRFPTTAPGGYTPDIQPIGTDLTAPGLWNSLQDPSVDYASKHSIELVGGTDNYIFVRGHSTIADIDVQSRVFGAIGAALLHPKEYATRSISAQVFGQGGTVDNQSISVADSDQFYLFNRPFDIKAPPNPNPGSHGGPWNTQPHYCLIAEVRQKRKCSLVFPGWPSDQVEDFQTFQDFQSWIASNPLVCYRNIGWIPCTPNPGNQCYTWQCWTRLVIPDSSFCTTFWTIIIECDSPIILPGSKWSLTCDDNLIFPNGVCFEEVPISTQSPACMGCHFTGATPGCAPSNIILSVTWCDGGRKIPPPSVKIRSAVTEVSMLSPIIHLAGEPTAGSDTWPFYVASKYPYVGNQPNPSPLPSFARTGRNVWPYPDSPQSVVGQVALAGKIQ